MVHDEAAAVELEDGFVVVHNEEGQYSVWWQDRQLPAGWVTVGPPGPRQACLERISALWTDMRPVSLRSGRDVR
jgi:MbtH protein